MKDTVIEKLFGGAMRAGFAPAIAIIEGLTQYDWEAAWPAIQKAMIGLGAAAIAAIQSKAIERGLTDLARRIAAFQPTASPMSGEPLMPEVPMPYIPAYSQNDLLAMRYKQIRDRANNISKGGAIEELGPTVGANPDSWANPSWIPPADHHYEIGDEKRIGFDQIQFLQDIESQMNHLPPPSPERCKRIKELRKIVMSRDAYYDSVKYLSHIPYTSPAAEISNTLLAMDVALMKLEIGCNSGGPPPLVTTY